MRKILCAFILLAGLLIGCATTGRANYSDLKWEVKEYLGYRFRGESNRDQRNRVRQLMGIESEQQARQRQTSISISSFARGWNNQANCPHQMAELRLMDAHNEAINAHLASLRRDVELVYAYLIN